MIIDQRRAHIKVLYERYLKIVEKGKSFTQKQMFPVQIEPEASDCVLLDDMLDNLKDLGLELEKKGNNIYSITGLPSDIRGVNPASLIETLLENYKNTGEEVKLSFTDKIALSLAKASAINYGRVLESEEMQSLFDRLFASHTPTYTPDGKLIVKIIEIDEIENKFS